MYVVRHFRTGREGTNDYSEVGNHRICRFYYYPDERIQTLEITPPKRCEVHTPEPVYKTLKEASAARQVTGDLVCYLKGGQIVKSFDWLWQFELEDPDSYAARCVVCEIEKAFTDMF